MKYLFDKERTRKKLELLGDDENFHSVIQDLLDQMEDMRINMENCSLECDDDGYDYFRSQFIRLRQKYNHLLDR